MIDQHVSNKPCLRGQLFCKACGNEDSFVEIMSFEVHLINRNLIYKRLLHTELDHYECYLCGEEVEYQPDAEVLTLEK